jgi:D-sedoheptulose 7-phosphate isomerase
MQFDDARVRTLVAEAARVIGALEQIAPTIARACDTVATVMAEGGTMLTCGNGGSAAEAMHLAEELIGKYREPRRPLPAVCLNADPTALTCIANDFGYDEVFARQVSALARPGHVLVAFSTSGKSPNVLRAIETARDRGAHTIALLGKDGGPAADLCDTPVVVPATATERIQEAHQVILHMMLDAVEERLAAEA